MTDAVLASVRKRIARRGGNLALSKRATDELILRELTQLVSEPPTPENRALLSAAARRVESSQRDHAEASALAPLMNDGVVTPLRRPGARAAEGSAEDGFDIDAEWPDFDEVGD